MLILNSLWEIARFCRTVLQRNVAAEWVKYLEITSSPGSLSGNQPFSSFYGLAAQALPKLCNLLFLRLAGPPEYATALRDCHFSRLRRFKTTLPFSKALLLFLNRHPDLSDLGLEIQLYQFYLQQSLTLAQLQSLESLKPLSHLQYYRGRSEFVPYLVQEQMPLRVVHLELGSESLNTVDDTLSALESFGSPTLEVLTCYLSCGWSLDLLENISNKLPHIELLTYCNLRGSNAKESQLEELAQNTSHQHLEVYNAFTVCAPRFSRLKSCFLVQPGPFDYSHMNKVLLNKEFKSIVSWGTLCPSLYSIKVPNGIQWMRDQTHSHLWIPGGEALSCAPQILHWFAGILSREPESVTAWRSLLRSCAVDPEQLPSSISMENLRKTLFEMEIRPALESSDGEFASSTVIEAPADSEGYM
ncbi:hypothetical protein D9758_009468 [Tetrapyrgos nigripes]|uniref:Uncharacterized protein n=1 Tax=Tetrapyrgos nigripes TaxID=182062 RepID=A0A8H5G177_9AGAR|nr:hypothetical protein D9758_009468 [Tetrapyrgos nigripes]